MIKLIELFAGIGTQHYAFSSYAEIENIGISEIDERPLKAYKKINGNYFHFSCFYNIYIVAYYENFFNTFSEILTNFCEKAQLN